MDTRMEHLIAVLEELKDDMIDLNRIMKGVK